MTEAVRQSIPRIRAVRFKAGGEVRLLKAPRASTQAAVLADLKEQTDWIVKNYDCLTGFVTWDARGYSMADINVSQGSPLTSFQVAEFAAERIRARLAEMDAGRVVRQMLSPPERSS